MLEDLSMGIWELINNSIAAGARNIDISLLADRDRDRLALTVKDDGCGMSPQLAKKVLDPFTTTRSTRRVGMGTSLLEETCTQCGGEMSVDSTPGKGTSIVCTFCASSIDLPPLGNIGEVMMAAVQANREIHYLLRVACDGKQFVFDSKEIADQLGGVPLDDPAVLLWIRDYINQEVQNIKEDGL